MTMNQTTCSSETIKSLVACAPDQTFVTMRPEKSF